MRDLPQRMSPARRGARIRCEKCMRAGWGGFEHRDRISTYGEYYGSKEEACGGTFQGYLESRSVRAQMHRLQQERRRGRRRAQSVPARCGLAPSWKMVSPAKITAAIHSQAGAAGPRAGPETIVRQAACMHTRVNRIQPNYACVFLSTCSSLFRERLSIEA